MYVKTGTKIYTIADLSRVWVVMDAYESDLPWLHYGHEVDFTVEALPGKQFQGRIAFIDPVLDAKTRTVKVRLSIPNPEGRLKPGMFVRAIVHSVMGPEGQAINPAMEGKWVSPMHPEIVKDIPGKCDVCGMALVRAEELGIVHTPSDKELPLVVPAEAILLTGKRAVVYVKKPGTAEPVFEGREVVLGARAGDTYIVLEGLMEGEEVVVNGNFKIDSAMQIAAKPSMMNPEGGMSATGHEHHGAEENRRPAKANEARVSWTQSDKVPKPMQMRTNQHFLDDLQELYVAYFSTQNALSRDELEVAKAALSDLRDKVQSLSPAKAELQGHAAEMWRDYHEKLLAATEHIHHWTTVEAVRTGFEAVSSIMIALEKGFGHEGDQTYYEIFCPMAFDNAGASWLQTNKDIMNPYFGKRMLRCGEVQASLVPRQLSIRDDEGMGGKHE
jgi:Cu(I)/Ag(I) efflux system membrane fusion protein